MNHKTLYIICAALLLTACDAVNLTPGNQYDKSYAFKNEENVNLYLNYFYQELHVFGQFGSNALGGSNSNMSDGLTDILKYGGIVAGVGDCNLIMTVDGQQSVSQNYFDCWTSGYVWIRRINEFLAALEEHRSSFDEAKYNVFKAEALFFRGFTSFYIMRSHASAKDDLGMILYDSIDQMSSATKDHERANLKDSWDYVYDDIKFAADMLPESNNGRLHKYAAEALMARAMLYAGRYDEAKKACEAVISSGEYGYIDDFDAIFADLTNPEIIYGYAYSKGVLTHSFDAKYSQPGDVCDSGNYGGGQAGPTQEFVDMFDNADGTPFDATDLSKRYLTNANVGGRDPRLKASVLYNGALWKGRAIECFEGGVDQKYMPYGSVNSPGNTVTGYYMRKLLDESNTDYLIDGSYAPWPEFRYAELMLIYAECLSREGKYSDAFDVISALRRKRFGRDDVFTPSFSDLESALDVILKERAVELCFEGHRFWDLRRTGRAAKVLGGKKYSGVYWHLNGSTFEPESISCDMGARKYPERFDRFPIPQTEIRNNSLARQNSDW